MRFIGLHVEVRVNLEDVLSHKLDVVIGRMAGSDEVSAVLAAFSITGEEVWK